MVLWFDADMASEVAAFRFHPSQSIVENDAGSLIVRFRAGASRRCADIS